MRADTQVHLFKSTLTLALYQGEGIGQCSDAYTYRELRIEKVPYSGKEH